jgi:hypothetical protein
MMHHVPQAGLTQAPGAHGVRLALTFGATRRQRPRRAKSESTSAAQVARSHSPGFADSQHKRLIASYFSSSTSGVR